MSKYSERHEITVVGIDLGKTWLQVCGQDASGRADAETICEAVQRPSMRFVGVKTVAQ